MQDKPKSLRRRRDKNKWEVTLTHIDPLTGEEIPTYHTVEGKTRKQAEQARYDLIVELELEGFSASTDMTTRQFINLFLDYKVQSITIESAFDDTLSVFQRDVEQRHAEMDGHRAGFGPKRMDNISPESIPFSVEELKAMLAVLEKAS